MAKLWSVALALLVGAGVWAAPAMAQSSDVEDVGTIQRGGAQHEVATSLGDRGLTFESEDYSLRVTTRVQFRLTHQQETANGNDGTNGRNFTNFTVRRAKTGFSGHIIGKEFTYNLLLSWTGGNIIERAWLRYAMNPFFNISAGQDKLQFNWEEITSSGNLQFVDRSYTNAVFNQNYAKGVWIDGMVGDDAPMLKYWFGVYNGVLRSNSDFRNADQAMLPEQFADGLVDTDMMVNLRLETHPLGTVAYGMNDMRGEDDDKALFALGLGVNWFFGGFDNPGVRADNAAGTPASGRSRTSQDTLSIVFDAHFRMAGLSLDMEVHYSHTEFHNRGANTFSPTNPQRTGIANNSDFGFSFQAAYFVIPEKVSLGLRYAMVDGDEHWSGGSSSRIFALRPDATELGVSANYYIHGNNLKLTMDIVYVSQQLAVPFPGNTLNGVYNAPPARGAFGGSSEVSDYNDLWLIRLQLQWIF